MEYQEQVKITPAGYPAGFALALTGYLLVFFIERVLFHIHGHAIHPNGHDDHCCETSAEEGKKKGQHHHHEHSDHHHHHEHSEGPQTCEDLRKSKRPYILLAAISVHSVLAGLTPRRAKIETKRFDDFHRHRRAQSAGGVIDWLVVRKR